MIFGEFEKLAREFFEQQTEVLFRKMKSYGTNEDCLNNLKDAADQLGLDPKQILLVYMHKHWSAIVNYTHRGVQSEPIAERLHDLANFCILFHAIVEDS